MDTGLPFFMRWEYIDTSLPDNDSVTHPGFPDLPGKRWWWPNWRWCWPSLTIEVFEFGEEGYYMAFDTGSVRMKTLWPIHTPHCNVRVGLESVTFYAIDAGMYNPDRSYTAKKLPVKWVDLKPVTRI